jgi:hypothetical protein
MLRLSPFSYRSKTDLIVLKGLMASIAEPPVSAPRRLPGRRHDHLFFFAMVLLLAAVVLSASRPRITSTADSWRPCRRGSCISTRRCSAHG